MCTSQCQTTRSPNPTLTVQPLNRLQPPVEHGYLVTNPPYGERIGSHAHVSEVYETLGERLKSLRMAMFFTVPTQ